MSDISHARPVVYVDQAVVDAMSLQQLHGLLTSEPGALFRIKAFRDPLRARDRAWRLMEYFDGKVVCATLAGVLFAKALPAVAI